MISTHTLRLSFNRYNSPMITKIEIDGYKGFEGFSLTFEPFTAIAGMNGVGKSNLFDAIRHLSLLATKTLRESFESDRGSLYDLFTLYPDGSRKDIIAYSIEVLLPRTVTDQFSTSYDLKYLRLRYELKIGLDQRGQFLIKEERLKPIKRSEDSYFKKHAHLKETLPTLTGGRPPFIDSDLEKDTITISQDGRAGNKRVVSIKGAQRTILSSLTTTEFAHAYAVKKLLENIHYLQLNPEKLRRPCNFSSPNRLASDGEYLAAMIARLIKYDQDIEQMIANHLASLIPSIEGFELVHDKTREEYVINVRHVDGYNVPAKLLSDGTLRMLALVAISYDPEFNGVIILEEPENGVHASRIPQIVKLLHEIATSSHDEHSQQIIINTHSLELIEVLYDNYLDNLVIAQPHKVTASQGTHTTTNMSYCNKDGKNIFALGAYNELMRNLKKMPPSRLCDAADCYRAFC
ncbi:MAG: AAA family ATPase [Deinococcales bacterium]